MKKPTKRPKLSLAATTIRDLQADQLERVNGGRSFTIGCDSCSHCTLFSITTVA